MDSVQGKWAAEYWQQIAKGNCSVASFKRELTLQFQSYPIRKGEFFFVVLEDTWPGLGNLTQQLSLLAPRNIPSLW